MLRQAATVCSDDSADGAVLAAESSLQTVAACRNMTAVTAEQ